MRCKDAEASANKISRLKQTNPQVYDAWLQWMNLIRPRKLGLQNCARPAQQAFPKIIAANYDDIQSA